MSVPISNIVFTKNRPLQLEGYLRSLYRFFPSELIKTYIIYKAEQFDTEYESVFSEFAGIEVIRESNFHRDILNVLSKVDTEYILFGIDDVVFFDGVDAELIFKTFQQAGDDIFGFTMRFDPASIKQGPDKLEEDSVDGERVYRLNWPNGQTKHSRYPFELCSTIYKTSLVKKIINGSMNTSNFARIFFSPGSGLMNILPFKVRRNIFKKLGFIFSPNTLESWPCRWSQNNQDKLPKYTYFQKLCAAAIQVNMVNTSTQNTFDGGREQAVESLNEKYRQGYRFDLEFLIRNKPSQSGCGNRYFKLVKR